MAEDLEELIHAGFSADEENESDLEETVTCLFSSQTFPSLSLAKRHLKSKYSFDIDAFIRSNRLNEIKTMSLINFIRTAVDGKLDGDLASSLTEITPESVIELIDSADGRKEWLDQSEKYLKPVIECDAFLYGLQSYDDSANEDNDEEDDSATDIKQDSPDYQQFLKKRPTVTELSDHTSSDESNHIMDRLNMNTSKTDDDSVRLDSRRGDLSSFIEDMKTSFSADDDFVHRSGNSIAIERMRGGHRRSVTVVRRKMPAIKKSAKHIRNHSRALSMDSVSDLKLTADMIHESTDRGSTQDIDHIEQLDEMEDDSDSEVFHSEEFATAASRKSTAIALDSSGDDDEEEVEMDHTNLEMRSDIPVSSSVDRHCRSQTAVVLTSDDGASQIKVTRDRSTVLTGETCSSLSRIVELELKNDRLVSDNQALFTEVVRLRQLVADSLNDGDDSHDSTGKDKGKLKSNHSFGDSAKGTSKLLKSDEIYFDSYSSIGIHEEMLRDRNRTLSYKQALSDQSVIGDRVVLDVGCGTGILSMFAAKYGAAKHVFGIDMADIIHAAKKSVNDNGLSDKVTLFMGKCEEIELEEKESEKKMVDVIVSEWMGYFLLFENMLESVIYARDKWLKPGGMVLPHTARMYMAAMDGSRFWKDRCYGVNLNEVYRWSRRNQEALDHTDSALKRPSETLGSEPLLLDVSCQDIMTEWCCFKSIDCQTVSKDELDFTVEFQLRVTSNDSGSDVSVDCLVCYFDTVFSEDNILSTAPNDDGSSTSHWHQTVFNLPSSIDCSIGDLIDVQMECVRLENNPRHYQVRLKVSHDPSGFAKDLIYFLE